MKNTFVASEMSYVIASVNFTYFFKNVLFLFFFNWKVNTQLYHE